MIVPNSDMLPRKTCFQESPQNEKQISVDPISIKERADVSDRLRLPPVMSISSSPEANGWSVSMPHPVAQVSVPVAASALTKNSKTKLLSFSLPNSAVSSPRFGGGGNSSSPSFLKKKWRNQGREGELPRPLVMDPLSRHHSIALARLAQLRENHLRRSRSCGEGRQARLSDEFDLWLTRDVKNNFCKNEDQAQLTELNDDRNFRITSRNEMSEVTDDKFKCGVLCLYLPGFSKGKALRARKEEEMRHSVPSRTMSLEKFECGSWSPRVVEEEPPSLPQPQADAYATGDSSNSSSHYFDLPFELIKNGMNDAESPVRAAFVFEDNNSKIVDRKGVLRNGGVSRQAAAAAARKSHESSTRHVRFSVSSPPTSPGSCITPRLRRARDDFTLFLEAQSRV